MIRYRKFWKLLSERGISQNVLMKQYHISGKSLYSMKHDRYISTKVLDRLCRILHCSANELLEQEKEDDELSELICTIKTAEHQQNVADQEWLDFIRNAHTAPQE